MLTIFSTPKPFRGHIDLIQRNAIRSWTLLGPEVEVILIGDDFGAQEVAREFGLRHEPNVRRNEQGTKYLASVFDSAQEVARHRTLCYLNCDIVLMSDFGKAVERVTTKYERVLMVGRRWDTNVTGPLDFASRDWEERLRTFASRNGKPRPPEWIDYFVFSRGLYGNIPPFVIGRPGWDPWLVWRARESGAAVVDASAVVMAVHQNHDYSYHPDGDKGVWHGEEAQRNYKLLSGGRCFATIENATHRLTPDGFKRNHRHWWALARRRALAGISLTWFALLGLTRPLRHALGLRQAKIASARVNDR